VLATVGVLAANAVYFALSASGLAAVHSLSAEAFAVVKWAGAAYLIYTGARMVVRSFRARDASASAAAPVSARRSFWQGFVTQGANPNLLVYFAAILPQFVDRPVLAARGHPSPSSSRCCRHARRLPSRPARRPASARWSSVGGLLVAAGAVTSLRRD
jgi:hypothetical protein